MQRTHSNVSLRAQSVLGLSIPSAIGSLYKNGSKRDEKTASILQMESWPRPKRCLKRLVGFGSGLEAQAVVLYEIEIILTPAVGVKVL